MKKSTGVAHYGFKREGGGSYAIEELHADLLLPTTVDGFNSEHVAKRGADPETESFLCALFSRNIPGKTATASQYGKPYVTFSVSCDPQFEEAMGTEKAKQKLRDIALEAWKPFQGSTAVWRIWPAIERIDDVRLQIRARFHLMTEEALRLFMPTE